MKKIIVTGGAGFIGSALVRHLIGRGDIEVLNIDKLTYAGNLDSLKSIIGDKNYSFTQIDIGDRALIRNAIFNFKPDAIMHLAAESHVDRSIDGPLEFIQTNVVGTEVLLECATEYWNSQSQRSDFRFLHISTDEVYGSLGPEGLFSETSVYDPRSPYSASKASSDHLVMAWHHTFGLPVIITNCSNNYGPYHYPEKLIPRIILNALRGDELPICGTGDNVRDWLYVDDHVNALVLALEKGRVCNKYNIGGNNEYTNLEIVNIICETLDDLVPLPGSYKKQIEFVKDRPGNDKRYAIDATKIKTELGWYPREEFHTGIRRTIQWYLDNKWWWKNLSTGTYNF